MSSLPADPSSRPWGDGGDARAEYRQRLHELDRRFLALAVEVADAITPANDALLAGDRRAVDAARSRDTDLRERCAALEDDCFVTIARESPVAADLRELVAIVRAVTDVARSSKLLVHVVSAVDRVYVPGMSPRLRHALDLLAVGAHDIFRAGVAAWAERDGLAFNELDELDDGVDRLQEGLLAELYGGHAVAHVVPLALLCRYYERLADHGVAIARHISWAVTGARVGGGA